MKATGWWLAGAGVAALAGIVFYEERKPSAASAPVKQTPPKLQPVGVIHQGPMPVISPWTKTGTIKRGDTVLVSMSPGSLALAMGSASLASWEALLSSPAVVSAFGPSQLQAWAPQQLIEPATWPADDPGASSNYRASFVYNGVQPSVNVSQTTLSSAAFWT